MATEVIKTVKPGGGGDYTTVSAWEAANRSDIVTADEHAVAECYSGGDCFPSAGYRLVVNSASWTTDATHRIIIRGASGETHSGVYDTNKARMGPNTSTIGMFFVAKNFNIDKMQTHFTTNGNYAGIQLRGGPSDLTSMFMFDDRTGHTATTSAAALNWVNPAGTCYLDNSVLMHTTDPLGNRPAIHFQGTAGTLEIRNCTLVHEAPTTTAAKVLIQCRDASNVCNTQNNYLSVDTGSTGLIYNAIASGTINQGSTDATSNTEATSASLDSVAFSTTNFVNVTAGSEDLEIKVASVLKDAGTDLSGSGITIDIRGEDRGTSHDIGAFELENSAPVTVAGTSTMSVSARTIVPSTAAGTSTLVVAVSKVKPVATAAGVGTMSLAVTIRINSFGAEIDCYDIVNQDAYQTLLTTEPRGSQSFTGTGAAIFRVLVWGYKTDSPAGALVAEIFAHSGTFGTSSVPTGIALATSTNSISVDDISATVGNHELELFFDGTFTPVNGTKYCLVLSGITGLSTNRVNIATDSTSPTHGGNYAEDV